MMAPELAARLMRMVEMYGDYPVQAGEGETPSVLLYDTPGFYCVSLPTDLLAD